MRIGIVAYGLDRPLTGIGRYTIELVRALQRSKQAPEIVLLAAGKPGNLEAEGFTIIRLPACRYLPALLTLGNFWIAFWARRLNLDLVHDPNGVAPFLLDVGKACCVATLHDVIPWVCPGNSRLLEDLIYRYWLPNRIRRLHAVITISSNSRRDILRYLPARSESLHIVPYGLPACFQKRASEAEIRNLKNKIGITSPYVLYVGALESRKNIPRLLEAFAKIHHRNRNLSLILAGPTLDPQGKIEKAIRRLGLADHVIRLGPVNDEDLPALYAGAQIFTFPSLYEGFGLPPLEAMASGTPVVCSNSSSLPEVVGDAAILVNPYEIQEWASAMQTALSNSRVRNGLRERGFIQVKKFTWEHAAQKTLEVYHAVMQRKPALSTKSLHSDSKNPEMKKDDLA